MGEDADGIGIDVNLVILSVVVAWLAKVRNIHNARDAVVVEMEVAMIVAVDECHHGKVGYSIGNVVPVVHILRLHRDVAHHEYGLAVTPVLP